MTGLKLEGQPAEVRLTLHVKRKKTGKVETFHLIGRGIPIPAMRGDVKEQRSDGDDAQH